MRNKIQELRANRTVLRPLVFLLIMLQVSLFSCKHQDLDVYQESENYRNAADFIANNYELSLFHAALQRSGLLEELRGKGPFTIFAPGNSAFNHIGIVRPSDFDRMNKDSLRFMLQYHILPRRLFRDDVPVNTIDNKYVNLAGKELYLGFRKYDISCPSCITNQLYVNGVNAPKPTQNVALANGVLHLLDEVLKYKPTVQELLGSKPEYSVLVTGLKHFGQWEQLSTAGPWTILAPSNEYFAAAGITTASIQLMSPGGYYPRLFGSYVARGHVFTSDWKVLPPPLGSRGPDFRAAIIGDEQYSIGLSSYGYSFLYGPKDVVLASAPMAASYQMNYKADNGVVHAINGVLGNADESKK